MHASSAGHYPLLWFTVCGFVAFLVLVDGKGRESQGDRDPITGSPHGNADDREARLLQALSIKLGDTGVKRDLNKAITLFRALIEEQKGDVIEAQALHELGDLYLMGIPGLFGVARDVNAAVKSFKDAAALGYGPSLHFLALASSVGIGPVKRNTELAVSLEYLSATTGYSPAILAMAFRLLYGYGLQADCSMALTLYRQVAEAVVQQQLQSPHTVFAVLQESSRIGPQTLNEWKELKNIQRQQDDVIQYWEAQAKNDDPVATYELAKLLEQKQLQNEDQHTTAESTNDVKERMASFYRMAGQAGVGAAHRDLALLHLNGDGVPQDLEKAVYYLHQAAAAGDADAQNYLGYFYYMGSERNNVDKGSNGKKSSSTAVDGRGVPFVISKDVQKAKKFFLQAALQEHPEALYFLGEMQQKAADECSGVERRKAMQEALLLYGKAAEGGYHMAWFKEGTILSKEAEANPNHMEACEAAALAYKAAAEAGPWVENARQAMQHYGEGDAEAALLLSLAAAEEGIEIAQSNAAFLLQSGDASIPTRDKDPLLSKSDAGSVLFDKPSGQSYKAVPSSSTQSKCAELKNIKQESTGRGQQIGIPQTSNESTTGEESVVFSLLNRAALQGNAHALREIGAFYLHNREGAGEHTTLGTQVLMKAFNMGDVQSLPYLSAAFESGGVLPKSLDKAEEMLLYFLETGGPQEVVYGFSASASPRGARSVLSGLRATVTSARTRTSLWRIRLKRLLTSK